MTTHRPITFSSPRGSALVATVIFGAILALLAGSILSWVRAERRLDQRQFLRLEARNAAEALAEWGFYQVRAKAQNASAYTASMFQPSGGSPVTLPGITFFQGGHVDTTSLELIGGATPVQAPYFVDPNDPNNFGDPLKGKFIFRRNIPVYSKVTVSQPGAGPPISAYVSETISIRGAPLFAHAIFYNMDLELSPGPTMVISGPVHANGNIWASSGGSSLTFQSSVTCTGNIYHAYKWASTTAVGTGPAYAGTGMNTNTSPVYINNVAGTAVNMNGRLNGESTNTWDDSTLGGSTAVVGSATTSQAAYQTALATAATGNQTKFRTMATSVWSGYVQTGAMGVQNYTPASIGAYTAQTTTAVDDSVNSARTIIEPPTAPASAQYNADVETQKFSNQAAVYIKIVPSTTAPTVTTTGTTTKITTTTYPAGTISVYTGGPPATGHLVTNASITNLVTYKPYKEIKTQVGSNTPTYLVQNGMYDQRNGEVASTSTAVGTTAGNTDLVELNMAGLRNVVTQMQLATGSQTATIALDGLTTGNWNGIVYVEVAGGPTTNTIATGGVTAGSTAAATNSRAVNTALRIINGAGVVATYGSANPGLTIATNAPLYVKGDYNATSTTGTLSSTAVESSSEVPACLAADAITLLSPNFSESNSKSSNTPAASFPSGSNVELATAMIIGNVPTDKNGNSDYSGGAHNLPRFLEDWSGKGTYIRGSLVCLYESRVANAPLTTNFYSPPNRNWGFSDLFKSGSYPPGTPKVMSYRRLDYSDLTAVQYAAAKAANP